MTSAYDICFKLLLNRLFKKSSLNFIRIKTIAEWSNLFGWYHFAIVYDW